MRVTSRRTSPLAGRGIFHLVTNRHAKPTRNQLAQITVKLMVGKAGHRRGILTLVAAGEREGENAGGGASVFMKELVKIAHAKEQERIGIAGFQLAILLHHRRKRCITH